MIGFTKKEEDVLVIEDIHVEVGGKEVLKGVNLTIPKGETHILFGPNGAGKTTLLMAIMGFEGYTVKRGKIYFNGIDITNLPVFERAKLGIGISFQRPPTIRGVKLKTLVETIKSSSFNIEELAEELALKDFLGRDVNDGFSGGEIKRSELLQLFAQNPELVLLDEPESGVDVENILLIGNMIARLLERSFNHIKPYKSHLDAKRKRRKMGLIISHTGFILEYVPIDKGHLLFDGRIVCSGNPKEIFNTIRKYGYEECAVCARS